MTWPRDMTDYTFVPDQSQLAIFHDERDIIRKEVHVNKKCRMKQCVCLVFRKA